MNPTLWNQVDDYFAGELLDRDAALATTLQASREAGLPDIAVSATQGKLLNLLARVQGARNILEIGTLGGYSTLWLAKALPPGGRIVTLEADPKHAEVARANLARAGYANQVQVRLGAALDTLPELETERVGPFDLTFIDADKRSNTEYFEWALRLSRRGSLIIVDNVVREGKVLDAASEDPSVQGVRRLVTRMSLETRVSVTAIQTVGHKGYDGFAIALVVA
ncbi:MAG: O-methyltransferase [Betaproteobacteria bacterium]|nr:O-methyltransferase [Betaproteobacteria bacterium]